MCTIILPKNFKWQVPLTIRHGDTRDISSLLAFKFYQPVYYFDYESSPSTSEKLGYWIGVARNVGDVLTFKVYGPSSGKVLNRSTVRSSEGSNQNKRAHLDSFGCNMALNHATVDGSATALEGELKLIHGLFAFLDNLGGIALLPGVLHEAISFLLLVEAIHPFSAFLLFPY